jgi:hypothetical protein
MRKSYPNLDKLVKKLRDTLNKLAGNYIQTFKIQVATSPDSYRDQGSTLEKVVNFGDPFLF